MSKQAWVLAVVLVAVAALAVGLGCWLVVLAQG